MGRDGGGVFVNDASLVNYKRTVDINGGKNI